LHLVQDLEISSHRAEITILEAARARAASDGRERATEEDVAPLAPMALRHRRSDFMRNYFEAAREETGEIKAACQKALEEGGLN
jgi:magnesium chelatase subunit I